MMTTTLGPLDQALHDFCCSLEAPMRAALFPAAKSRLRFPDSAGEVIGTMKVAINRQASHFDFSTLQWVDIEGCLNKVSDTFETPEWVALVEALRDSMQCEAWPITIDIRFYGEQCASECSGLGFAGLHSYRPLESQGILPHPSDLFLVEPEGLRGIYGLDRIAEAMLWLLRAMAHSPQWSRPICAWSLLEEASGNELCWIGVHAKSEIEAILKIAIHRDGFEAARAAYDRQDLAALGTRDDATLVPVRLAGLQDNPLGEPAPMSSSLMQLWGADEK